MSRKIQDVIPLAAGDSVMATPSLLPCSLERLEQLIKVTSETGLSTGLAYSNAIKGINPQPAVLMVYDGNLRSTTENRLGQIPAGSSAELQTHLFIIDSDNLGLFRSNEKIHIVWTYLLDVLKNEFRCLLAPNFGIGTAVGLQSVFQRSESNDACVIDTAGNFILRWHHRKGLRGTRGTLIKRYPPGWEGGFKTFGSNNRSPDVGGMAGIFSSPGSVGKTSKRLGAGGLGDTTRHVAAMFQRTEA